jgi:excinuclease UvrABC nuclease subunit
MKDAARDLEFELAAILRDEIQLLIKEIKKRDTATAPTASRPKRPPRHGRTH